MQQGWHVADNILRELRGQPRRPFRYFDKGIMATIGRSRAIAQTGRWKLTGLLAWLAWLLVHIYYLTGFRNRLLVVLQWGWSFISFRRGARLIVNKEWRFHPPAHED
jgi:NADH dehydrogenase